MLVRKNKQGMSARERNPLRPRAYVFLLGNFSESFCVVDSYSLCRVSSIDAASDASIVDLSIERKVTPPIGSVLQANPTPLVPIGGIGNC